MVSFDIDWQPVIGLAVTMLLGTGIGCLVRRVQQAIDTPEPPSDALRPQWDKLLKMQTGGSWIGRLEGPIFFASLWVEGWWPLMSSWLVFKLAVYWQSSNYAAFPSDKLLGKEEADLLVAKRQLGSHHVATLLVGTAANIVTAIVGVAIGHWIVL